MLNTQKNRQRGILKIFQANTARGQTNHDLALALAHAESADIILIQEPWTFPQKEKRMTKQHPDYIVFCPVDSWEARPRVMTYVRKGRNLQPSQIRPSKTKDICWITIQGTKGPIHITNIYRPPQELEGGEVITALKQWRVPLNTIIAGDFNTRHPYWDSRARVSKRAEELVNWAHQNNLILVSPANECTHRRGSVLDLVFTNILGTQCSIEEHLHTTSDHETLITTIPLKDLPVKNTQDRFKLTPEAIPRLALGVKETLKPVSQLPQDPDLLANTIIECIQSNVARFLPRKRYISQGTKWWNQDCREKAASYRRARKKGDATAEKIALRKATRAAKKAYWQNQIQNASSPADIFKITSWHKNRGTFSSPPIVHEGKTFTGSMEKASVLRKALLERETKADDITEFPDSRGSRASLQVEDYVDEAEVKRCLLQTSSTAPGIDGLTVATIRACWDYIKDAIVVLYQRCITLGYHPKAFQRAEVVVLPKPNKRDLSSVRAWRPIALLSCLGKGLERLIARLLSKTSLKYGVLSPQQFGALPKRSALDLVGCLIHEIEKARSRGMMSSLLTLDVKGAFDTVLPGRMRLRLGDQGWPDWIIKWVWSFMTNRTVRIRLDDTVTQETPLNCGLPQGSPVSPILFMLYTEPILRQGEQKMKFSFADDVAILQVGHTLTECTRNLEREAQLLLEWGDKNGVYFDIQKCELQHFTVSHKPKEYPGMIVDEHFLPANQVTRWLGVWMDRKLSFLHHTRHWAAKGMAVAAHLRRLNKTVIGSPPHLVRQAVKTCILPTALYGAEAWWPGESTLTWRNKKPKETKHRCGQHMKLLTKVLHMGLRAILPAYRTAPISALHREAGIPPVSIILEDVRLRKALRIQTLDPRHPLRKRAYGKATTRLTKVAQLLPISEDAELASFDNESISTLNDIQTVKHDIHLFTDGALTVEGRAGGAFIILQAEQRILAENFNIDKRVDPIDTEIIAIMRGIKASVQKALTHFANNIIVFTDSKLAANIVNGKSSLTSRKEVREIRNLQRCWKGREKLPHVKSGHIFAKWVPSHSGIPENEEVDMLAKRGAQIATLNQPYGGITHAAVKQMVMNIRTDLEKEWWRIHSPARYKLLNIKLSIPGKYPSELRLRRKELGELIAARTGHGDFKSYHERFQHENFARCTCGGQTAPTHFFFCREYRHKTKREIGKRSPQMALEWLLGTSDGAVAFGRIINNN